MSRILKWIVSIIDKRYGKEFIREFSKKNECKKCYYYRPLALNDCLLCGTVGTKCGYYYEGKKENY